MCALKQEEVPMEGIISGRDTSRPFTLQDVYRNFMKPTLEVLHWLQELGLIAKEFKCGAPNCKSLMALTPSICIDDYQWVCINGKHSYHKSVRSGTWFEGTRLALKEVFTIIYFWINEFSQAQVRQELNITNSKSIVAYYSFCREIAVDTMISSSQQIGGYGYCVEIVAYKFPRRKKVKGKKSHEQWAYCGVDLGKKSDKCFMELVDIHYTSTFIEVIKKYVLPGSTIYNECLQIYHLFDQQGLQDLCSEHSVVLTDDLSQVSTSCKPFQDLWSLLKPTLPTNNKQRDNASIAGYLGEYLYRRKIRNISDKFLRFVNDIATLYEPATSAQK